MTTFLSYHLRGTTSKLQVVCQASSPSRPSATCRSLRVDHLPEASASRHAVVGGRRGCGLGHPRDEAAAAVRERERAPGIRVGGRRERDAIVGGRPRVRAVRTRLVADRLGDRARIRVRIVRLAVVALLLHRDGTVASVESSLRVMDVRYTSRSGVVAPAPPAAVRFGEVADDRVLRASRRRATRRSRPATKSALEEPCRTRPDVIGQRRPWRRRSSERRAADVGDAKSSFT